MKSVSIFIEFATLYLHLTIYRSYIEYWPYGRVALHIQCKNIRETQFDYSYMNLGPFGQHLHGFAKYGYKSTQFHFYMKSVSIYVEFATLCLHLTIYRSFIEYWLNGRVALYIQKKTYEKHNPITCMWIWDDLDDICMVLRNKTTNRLNFISTWNPCQFMLNLLLYISIWQYDAPSSNTGLMDK
jgi:hypothetical protein